MSPPKASVLSDSLVWSGWEAFAKGFVSGVEGDSSGRDEVFFASLMAGVGSGQGRVWFDPSHGGAWLNR